MFERRTIHDVSRGSNLDFLLRATIGALNRFSGQLGVGLKAIATALSSPGDNSTMVQAEINRLVAELNASSTALEDETKKSKEK